MEPGNFDVNKKNGYLKVFLWEFLGTFVLVLGVNFSHGYTLVVMAGIFQACIVTCRGTGAHFNMGLTMAIYIEQWKFKQQFKVFLVYHLAEFLGSYMAMVVAYGYLRDEIACIAPGSLDYSTWYVFFVELLFTFLMMMVIMTGKHPKLSLFDNMVTGILGSLGGIYFSASCVGPLTGAIFNANLALSNLTFCAAVIDGKSGVLKFLPAYLFADYIGAALAGVYVRFVALHVTPPPLSVTPMEYKRMPEASTTTSPK